MSIENPRLISDITEIADAVEKLSKRLRHLRDSREFHPPERSGGGILLPVTRRRTEMLQDASLAIRHLEDANFRIERILHWYNSEE